MSLLFFLQFAHLLDGTTFTHKLQEASIDVFCTNSSKCVAHCNTAAAQLVEVSSLRVSFFYVVNCPLSARLQFYSQMSSPKRYNPLWKETRARWTVSKLLIIHLLFAAVHERFETWLLKKSLCNIVSTYPLNSAREALTLQLKNLVFECGQTGP